MKKDTVAVVTGAGGTLCSVIAKDIAARGGKVVLIGRTKEKLETVETEIRAAGGVCMVAPGDVTDEVAMREIADRVLAEFGACNILVNGAGGNNSKAMTSNLAYDKRELADEKPADMVGFFDLDMDIFESVVKINTLGTVIPTRVFGAQMAKNGGGSIINFASMNSYRPLTRVPAYAMAKAGIVNLTQWLAAYLAPAKIRVNAIAPGFFINERSKKFLGTPETGLTERGQNVMAHTPMKKFGEAEELLGAFRYLTNDEDAAFTTGITIPVDGGFLSSPGL